VQFQYTSFCQLPNFLGQTTMALKTYLLLQLSPDTRVYQTFESGEEAIDAIVDIFEEHLLA